MMITMVIKMNYRKIIRYGLLTLLLFIPFTGAFASFGVTNYELGTKGLMDMTEFTLASMSVVVQICFAIGTILAIYGATTIYIKMQNGEDGVIKSIYLLVGACIFLVAMTIVFPEFFGWSKLFPH